MRKLKDKMGHTIRELVTFVGGVDEDKVIPFMVTVAPAAITILVLWLLL